jgi:ABC-type antimicrobial peptide transport system permease subunit
LRYLATFVLAGVLAAPPPWRGGAAGPAGQTSTDVARLAASLFTSVQLPGVLAVGAAAAILLAAAIVASWMPAARAARIDVLEALRSD